MPILIANLNRFRYLLHFFMIVGLGSLSACSSNTASTVMPTDFRVAEVAIYMHRANMAGIDFEQYKFFGGRLFHECGVMLRGKNVPTQQKLYDIKQENERELMLLTWRMLELSAAGQAALEESGNSSSLLDPGYLAVRISGNENKLILKTSVDATVEVRSEAAKVLNKLVRNIRTLAHPAACGNRNFYGLEPLR